MSIKSSPMRHAYTISITGIGPIPPDDADTIVLNCFITVHTA